MNYSNIKFYLAPLEGITGYIYRDAVRDFFGECIDKYFTPFFTPHTKRTLNSREINDILPEHNEGIHLVPQILTNSSRDYLRFEQELMEFGYREFNLNLGCPSNTVTPKGRGAGFLTHLSELEAFLEEVWGNKQCELTIKTRLGMTAPDEFCRILEIYNKFPMKELIIHPRVKSEMYQGSVHRDMFAYAMQYSSNPLCYNGDINSAEDLESILTIAGNTEVAKVTSVMIGRGMVANPSLIRELKGGEHFSREEIKGFLKRLLEDYKVYNSGEVPVLHKMKEVWSYLHKSFPDRDKSYRKLMKSNHLDEYMVAVQELLNR